MQAAAQQLPPPSLQLLLFLPPPARQQACASTFPPPRSATWLGSRGLLWRSGHHSTRHPPPWLQSPRLCNALTGTLRRWAAHHRPAAPAASFYLPQPPASRRHPFYLSDLRVPYLFPGFQSPSRPTLWPQHTHSHSGCYLPMVDSAMQAAAQQPPIPSL